MSARKPVYLFAVLIAALVVLSQAVAALRDVRLEDLLFLPSSQEVRRGDALEADRQLMTESMRSTQQARDDLIAGRLSLRQTLLIFEAEDARRPSSLRRNPLGATGETQRERCARALVCQIGHQLKAFPEHAHRLAEIENELRQYLAEEDEKAQPGFTLAPPS